MADPAPNRATLGERVKQARLKLGLSHDKFAVRLGSNDRGLVIRWEKKGVEPSARYRLALARETGHPAEWFSLARPAERATDYATRAELAELRAVLVEMLPLVPAEHRSVLEARLRAGGEG